jgi:pyruvate dehydrogenase E1 component alpha subunit
VIFVCENNLWAAMSPLADRQPPVDIHRRAEGYGVASAFVQDGNDVIAVHEAMAAAVARARAGGGPTLLECRTYRWLEHCGPNDDTVPGFRDTAELAAWRARCPIERARKLVSEAEDRQFRAEIAREIHDAFAHAKDKPAPVPTWSVPAWAGPTG